jgi:predicted Zn finger-like uncharacterized protein
MADDQFTRCPGCRTIFRVTGAQLALRDGQVRCGHCRTVFDGRAHKVSLAAGAAPGDDEDAERGPPTVTLRPARALKSVDEPDSAHAPGGATIGGSTGGGRATVEPAAAAGSMRPPGPDAAWENRFAWDKPEKRRATGPLVAVGAVLLVLLLAAQAAWHFRDAIAAHFPATRPLLVRACAIAGCTIRPLRDVAALAIEASDLQADAAHRGLLILNATVRNRAGYAIAFPHLELTLTDAQDQAVVRRAFAPQEFAGGTTDVAAGIPGRGDATVKLYIDASATQQAGYRLYLFYP